MSDIGFRLKEWRTRRSLSQAELADRAGIAKLTVTRLERPGQSRPHPKTIRLLAEALNVEPTDLVSFDGPSTPGRRWAAPGSDAALDLGNENLNDGLPIT